MSPESPRDVVQPSATQYPSGIPRWMEAVCAAVALVVLAPVAAVLAAAVRLSSPGPALFRQQRVGCGGQPFTMYKFRTMRVGSGGPQITADDDRRVTSLGRLLRKTKLDEMPELWNVVRGDMSLVGPRPEVAAYVDLRDPAWVAILCVRPGLTDPVTATLRHEEELLGLVDGDREAFYRTTLLPFKLAGYQAYLNQRTFRSDLRTLAATAVAVFLPRESRIPSQIVPPKPTRGTQR
jgi:lipopolysaccharide/colanic/teichoic acid biosynthesis glycosyltransferase